MKVIVEKQEAEIIQFDNNKNYPVTKDFVKHIILGFAKISLENGIMYADLNLKENIKGYPAVGYIKNISTGLINLEAIGICSSPNLDENIKQIKYIKP